MRLLPVLLTLLVLAVPAFAGELRLDGSFMQGELIRGHTEPGAKVAFDGRDVRVADDGSFIFGFGRDFGATAALSVVYPDGSEETRTLEVRKRDYDIQRIDGLPEKMVTPPAALLARIHREAALVAKARAQDSDATFYETPFIWPVTGVITGIYGSQRILNGKPRWPHYGVDIAAPKGTPVQAPADGVVTLAQHDFYYTGGTILLDHGHGLNTAYSHLSKVLVKVGDQVRQGEVIGLVGAAGRATGPHLDWRVNWFDQRLDPARVVPPMPAAKKHEAG